MLEALGDEVPRAILLTHIHLDHAGATGALVRLWPGAREGVNALIRNPAASSGSVYLGATNVNTGTGFELEPGAWVSVPLERGETPYAV